MKNKLTAVISVVVCLLLVASVFTACSVKKGENENSTTLTPDDNWRPGDDQAYQPVQITDVELVKLVNKALGDEAKGFNGDLSTLTAEQMKKVKEEAKKEGYVVESDESGDPIIKKEPTSEVSSNVYEEILSEAEVEGTTGLTPEEYEKVSKAAEDKGLTALTGDEGGITIVSRVVPTTSKATTSSGGNNNPGVVTDPTTVATKPGGNTSPSQTFTAREPGTVAAKTTAVLSAFGNTYGNGSLCNFQGTAIAGEGSVSAGNTMLDANGKVQTYSSGVVVKFNEKGKKSWASTISSDDMTGLHDIAVLADGSVIAVGYTMGENFPASSYKCKGSVEGLMAKFNAKGEKQWVKFFGGSGGDEIYCVAACPDGGYVIGGNTTSKDFDLKGTSDQKSKAFIAKMDANGNLQWVKAMGGSKNVTAQDIAVSDKGYIFVTVQALCIDGDMAKYDGPESLRRYNIVIKYNPDGSEDWNYVLHDAGNLLMNSICTGNDSGCVVAGYYSTKVNGNTGIFKNIYNGGQPGTYDGAIVKIDGNGKKAWVTPLIGFQSDYITGIDKINGGYAISGYTTSTNRDFAFTNKGEYDSFVYVISNYGKLQASTSFAGSEVDRATGIASNGKTVYVCGSSLSADGSFANCDYKPSGDNSVGFLFKFDLQQN